MYSSACVCVWARCDWRESGALCFLLSLFHMHVFRLCGGDGGWRVIVFRWCYPFVSLSLFPAKEKRFWSLLLAHLPAVYHNVNPTHSQKTDRSRSLGPACLYTKIQITLLYPLISPKKKTSFFLRRGQNINTDGFFSFQIETHIFDDWSQIYFTANVKHRLSFSFFFLLSQDLICWSLCTLYIYSPPDRRERES